MCLFCWFCKLPLYLLCQRVFFVASVPGSHRGADYDKWGHRRLGHLLKKHVPIPTLLSPSESKESWPIIAQCSSVGTLGADPNAWMCGELRTSMSQRAVQPGDLPQPPPKFKVVSSFIYHSSRLLSALLSFLFRLMVFLYIVTWFVRNTCQHGVQRYKVGEFQLCYCSLSQ